MGRLQRLLIALLLGILAVLVFALSAGALFVFAIGVALAFFLVPVVNRLERRGMKRWVAAVVTVVVTVLAALVVLVVLDLRQLVVGACHESMLPDDQSRCRVTYPTRNPAARAMRTALPGLVLM